LTPSMWNLAAIEKQDRDERGGVITFRETIRNQREEEVVVGTMRSYIAKREAGTA